MKVQKKKRNTLKIVRYDKERRGYNNDPKFLLTSASLVEYSNDS